MNTSGHLRHADAPGGFSALIDGLAEQGYAVQPHFLVPELSAALRAELLQAWAHGRFHTAGIGRGARHRLRPEIRSDHVHWLDESAGGPVQRRYLELLEALRLALNRELFLGLARFEGHFAVYPPGSHYRRHLDSFQGTRQRIVSTVLYLNPDWQVEDAGALRLYLPAGDGEHIVDVLPEDGTFVCFLSERIPHEVLPPRRRRLSVTGWFRLRD